MRFPPPSVIQSWPKPNYVDPVQRGPALMAVDLTLLGLALMCVCLRLYVRIGWLHKSWWDDYIMVLAAVFCIGTTVIVILASQRYGWNIHVWDMTYRQMEVGRQASMAAQALFVLASTSVKASILVSYLRIAPNRSLFRRFTWATLATCVVAGITFFAALFTQCVPISSYWNFLADPNDCIPEGPPLLAQTVINVVTDTMVYLLPMPTLFALRLPASQRIGLMVLFGFGGSIVIAGSFRAYWVHYVVFRTYDVTWYGYQLWIWTAVETNIGVVCGCIPALKPLFFGSQSRLRNATGSSSSKSFGSAGSRTRRPTQPDTGGYDGLELDTHGLTSEDSHTAVESVHTTSDRPVSGYTRHSMRQSMAKDGYEIGLAVV